MAKKITAPKTYDPGKGRPKEHLAYLNEREMAYLRSINGNNMERGPKGLPSFPPKDAVGSSSKASPSRGPGGPSGPNSSPSGSRGIGGGGKGSTTGGRGPGGPSGPNSAASGSRGVGGGTKGPGGPSGPNSGPSASRGPSQAKTPSSGGYKGPASPMSGQGTSFKSPSTYSDRSIQQKVQTASTQKAVRSVPAVRSDLSSGGIRTLNVGPMGTPVRVGAPKPSVTPRKEVGMPVTATTRYGTGYYNKFSPSLPGMNAPDVTAPVGAAFDPKIYRNTLVNEAGISMVGWTPNADPNRLTPGAQKIYRAVEDAALRTNTPVEVFSGKRNSGSPQHDIGQALDVRIMDPKTGAWVGESQLAGKYGPARAEALARNPIASVRPKYGRTEAVARDVEAALGPGYRGFAKEVIGSFMENPDVYGDFRNQRWGGSFQSGATAKDYMHFDEGKAMSAVSPDQARLRSEAARLVSGRPTQYALGRGEPAGSFNIAQGVVPASAPVRTASIGFNPAKAASDAYETVRDYYNSMPSLKDISQGYADVQKSIDAYRQAKTGPLSAETGPIADAKIKEAVTDYAARGINALKDAVNYGVGSAIVGTAYAGVPSGPLMSGQKAAVYTINKAEGEKILKVEDVPEATVRAEDAYGPKYVSPEVQEEMADIDKMNRRGIRGAKAVPGLGTVFRAADAIRGAVTGTNTAEADADLKRAYMQGNAAQRAELERRNPNLTKFAQQAGLEPQLPMSNYENWRQRSFGTGGAGGVSTTVVGSGGTPDFGSGGKFQYRPGPGGAPYSPPPTTTEKAERGRPQQYYNWDAGVGIPSPGDSDYTLYLKYLEEKAAARAAVS